MTKNLNIIDLKPQNLSIIDPKSRNFQVQDTQPRNLNTLTDFGTEQLFTVVLAAGQSMGPGFFMFIPYLTAGTIQSPITN